MFDGLENKLRVFAWDWMNSIGCYCQCGPFRICTSPFTYILNDFCRPSFPSPLTTQLELLYRVEIFYIIIPIKKVLQAGREHRITETNSGTNWSLIKSFCGLVVYFKTILNCEHFCANFTLALSRNDNELMLVGVSEENVVDLLSLNTKCTATDNWVLFRGCETRN